MAKQTNVQVVVLQVGYPSDGEPERFGQLAEWHGCRSWSCR
jgi:hypothetical protein